ncbi:MAG TPA: Flp family type IVb pilin [Rhizomicrobium sp.]|jgi:Flp pilus assembly pilin Flp|nr:Flp family type IVb pilin [Rhizomicrobium sp.]
MRTALLTFLSDRSAVTGIEYGIIAFGVALMLVSAAGVTGHLLKVLLRLAAALSSHGLLTQ